MGWTSVISDGRRKAKEDRDSAYEAEIRRRKIAELQRLDEIRKLKESRRPTYISDFGQDEQTNTQTNTQANTQTNTQANTQADTQADTQATYGQIPEFNLDAQNELQTELDAAILQRGKDYDTAVANENLRQSGVSAARGKLLELQAAQKDKGYEQYLPQYEVPTDAGHSGLQKLFGADADRQANAQDFVASSEDIVQMGSTGGGWGRQASGWLGINNTGMTDVEFQTALAKSNEVEQFFNTDLIGDSDAEKYFTLYPDEITKANPFYGMSKAELNTVDPRGDKRRAALAEYYFNYIKPQLTGDSVDALKPIATASRKSRKNGGDTVVHTKAQIAKADAQHRDFLTKIRNGINTLDDDIANAPAFMEKLNKDKKVSEKELQDLYKDQLTESNAAQLAKVSNTKIDPSLLDPRQLGGLVKQHYQQRQLLKYKAQHARKVAERSGDWTEYDTLRAEISEKDVSIYEAIGHQGISDLKLNNDPRRISAVLSKFANTKTIVQPRSDGNYNIITNGKLSGKPRTAAEIKGLVQMYSSPTFRAQSAEYDKKQTEHQIEGQETPKSKAENETSIIKAYLTEVIKGSNEQDKLALEQRLKGREVKFSSSGGDSGGFLTTTDGTTILYNPTPGTSPSGTRLSEFTDISSQIPRAIFPAIRNGTIDFNKAEFWKEIGLPNPLLNK